MRELKYGGVKKKEVYVFEKKVYVFLCIFYNVNNKIKIIFFKEEKLEN